MNKQLAFIIVASIAGLGLVAVVVLMIIKPDAAATFSDYLLNLLLLIGGFGGLAAQQAQQQRQIETIKRNTNGTLTAKEQENTALRGLLAEKSPRALAQFDADRAATGPILDDGS